MRRLLAKTVAGAALLAALEVLVGAPGELFPGGFTLFGVGGAVVIIRGAKMLAPLILRAPENGE